MQTRSFLSPKIDVGKLEPTWIGPDAIRDPTIPPPKTRPSGLARETLNIPVLPFAPLVSSNVNDPHRERISKRPCSILYQWLGDQDLPSEQQNIHKKQRSVHLRLLKLRPNLISQNSTRKTRLTNNDTWDNTSSRKNANCSRTPFSKWRNLTYNILIIVKIRDQLNESRVMTGKIKHI